MQAITSLSYTLPEGVEREKFIEGRIFNILKVFTDSEEEPPLVAVVLGLLKHEISQSYREEVPDWIQKKVIETKILETSLTLQGAILEFLSSEIQEFFQRCLIFLEESGAIDSYFLAREGDPELADLWKRLADFFITQRLESLRLEKRPTVLLVPELRFPFSRAVNSEILASLKLDQVSRISSQLGQGLSREKLAEELEREIRTGVEERDILNRVLPEIGPLKVRELFLDDFVSLNFASEETRVP